jgi:molecular chaperone GrpE
MADSTEKPAGAKPPSGHFEADVGEDVIRAALESVQRHSAPAPASPPGVEIEVGAEGADVDDDAQPPVEGEPQAPRSNDELEKELKEVKATLELSAELAKETHGRLKDTHERQLRAVADLDNYKKRAAREREEAEKFAIGKLLKELLPVLDNLDRALEHAAATAAEGPLATGVQATRKLFDDILGKFGVKSFSAKGQPFDPNRHEAMQQIPTSEVPPGTVAKEIVRGYLLNDRLLRPALVGVAVAPPSGNGVETRAAAEMGAAEGTKGGTE